MKRIAIITLTMLFSYCSYASHFSGGEIRYEYNGSSYDIYVSLYKLCVGGASLPTNATVRFYESGTNQTFTRAATLQRFDTVNINCPNTQSRCYNTTSTIPGYITGYYKLSNESLSKGNWTIYTTNTARIAGIVNLVSNAATMYISTTLDNTTAINSNALMANSPSYYMTVGNNSVFPLQAVDPEGDALSYDMVTPLSGGTYPGTASAYNAGYSLTAPFGTGGMASINNNILTLSSPNQGNFALALRIREHRNGVLISTVIREFMVAVLPSSTGVLTTPAPFTSTAYNYYTCPGQSNSIVLNFADPTVTDSVYLDVVTPSFPGWAFNVSTTNGTPSASTTITWNTPSNMNPATLPHFYIKVRARDNACPRSVADYAIAIRTRQCNADSVWPGDANGDFTVNVYDPLAIAIASGQTGATRVGANTTWSAQWCANWTNSFFTNNTNMKHADCNGDGTINNTDLAAVNANYNKTHQKGPRNKTTGINDLYFDMNGIVLAKGKTVSIPIKLGSGSQTVSDVYGIATRVAIDGMTLSTPATITTNSSWIENTGNGINFTQPISNNVIDWAHARTNHTNVSGNGTIGMLTFTVPHSAKKLDKVSFSFSDPTLINKDGIPSQDFNTQPSEGIIQWANNIDVITDNIEYATVVPNPSNGNAYLNVSLQKKTNSTVVIRDISGRVVWRTEVALEKGIGNIALPSSELSRGMYIINVDVEENSMGRTLKWIKN